MVWWRCIVSEKAELIVETAHHHINIAISVYITESHSATHLNPSREIGGTRTHIGESNILCWMFRSRPSVLKEKVRFSVEVPEFTGVRTFKNGTTLHPSVDECNVQIGIIIEVHETTPKPCKRQIAPRESHHFCHIHEHSIGRNDIKCICLTPQVCQQQIGTRITVDITDSDTHATFRLSIGVKRQTVQYGFLSKSAIPLVYPKLVRLTIVRDIKIRPTIACQIKTHNTESSAGHCRDSRLLRYIRESAVAVVSEQPIHRGFKDLWIAVIWSTMFSATHRLWIELNVVCDIEIKVSIPVIITKGRRSSPRFV